VKLVWIVDPEAREVCVYRPGHDPYVVTENEELTGEDVLPGFRCRVSEFFKLPGKAQKPNGSSSPPDPPPAS
jgi:Uma2 family endonuclease